MIDRQLPPDALAAIRSAHGRVFLAEVEPVVGGCQNCGGTGTLWLQFETNERGDNVSLTFVPERTFVVSKTYPCPICAAHDREVQREYAWGHSGLDINERTWRVDFIADMDGKENAYRAALDLLAQTPAPAGMLTVFGDYGRGKTGLLKALTAQFVLADVSARYVRAADLLGEIRSTYGDESKTTEEQIITRIGSLHFLAVDEVDRIPSTDWAMSTMMRVLDTRYARRHRCATAIATNQRPDALPEQWGYLQSRLTDGVRVPVGGADLRGG